MKIILTLSVFFLSLLTFAQGGGPPASFGGKNTNASQHIGKVSGYLIDAKSGDKLPFANVRLFRKNDILMEGTITNESGYFAFEELGLASYYLLVNYVGYEETKVVAELNKNKTFLYFKKVKVNPGAVNLDEVSIVEDKPIYESKMEKIVYNAENDLNESLDDATDVLRKTPLLSVDMDGNVSLRGSSDVKFLVNGKESTFFTSSASDALQMIPADQVKSVEVITSPTAKYEGEGSSGIINIITKTKNISGFKSTIRGSFGTRVNKQNADINYGNGKFGFSARASARYGWPLGGQSTSYTRDFVEETTLFTNAQTKGQWIGFGGSSEVYYDFNPYNSIVSSVSLRGNRQTRERWASDSLYSSILGESFVDQFAFVVNDTNEYTNTKNLRYGYEWTTDYVRKFSDHEDRELRLAFQLGGDVSDEDNKIFNNSLYSDTLIDKNDGSPLSYTFQLDYVHPFMDKHTIELGSKYVNRNMINNYSTITKNNVIYQSEEQFDYQQDVFALYFSSKWELTKEIGLILGLRMENTKNSGLWMDYNTTTGQWEDILSDPNKSSFEKDYTTFLPNVILSKKIDMTKSLKGSYSKRISRPGMRYINPNTSYTESSTQTIGNPLLKPAITQQLELGYNSFARKYKGSYYLFAKRTTDLVETVLDVNGGDKFITYQNLGENNSFGFNYYGSISLGDNLNFRGGFNLFTFQTTVDDLGILLYNWNMGGNYDLGKGYKAETFGFFRAPNQTSQGINPGFSMFSIGFKKEFKNKKGSIGLRFVEPFKEYKSFVTELEEPGEFYQYSQNDVVFRSIGISFKYTFGELKFDAIKDRTNIKNDDVMQEGGQEY
jgi:ferric enterobactin receptor